MIADYINLDQLDVVIPSTIGGLSVTSIGDEAFFYKNLASVIIPNCVKIIGENAFMFKRFTSITIPDSVITIGRRAFYLNQLTSVSILGDSTRFNSSWDIIGFSAVPAP